MNNFICKQCQTHYTKKKSIKKSSFCSRGCKHKYGHTEETKKKISEKRAKQIHIHKPVLRCGYIYFKSWGHPNCGKQGYVAEHRLVMEKHLGRYLLPNETIHHINHNQTDNRIENLQLFSSRGEHTRIAHPEVIERSRIFNKGKRYSIATEFKKGQIPWNKKK